MIELFSANTPNGWKIGIMLEEIGYQYKVTKIDLGKDEQFDPEFLKISPSVSYTHLTLPTILRV